MNKIQRNAKAYAKLLDVEYIFYLGYKGKCKKVVLRFAKEDFSHLEGLGQLVDLPLHRFPSTKIFNMALHGEIKESELEKSKEYNKHFIERKINHLYLLEDFIDNNEIVFNYIKRKTQGTSIQAKIFLYKDLSGQDVYLFLDSASNDDYYYGRSFIVSPLLNFKSG